MNCLPFVIVLILLDLWQNLENGSLKIFARFALLITSIPLKSSVTPVCPRANFFYPCTPKKFTRGHTGAAELFRGMEVTSNLSKGIQVKHLIYLAWHINLFVALRHREI